MSTVSGTPAYMAPEVLIGSYSAQCDIFSLGLVFCMMVECPNPLIPLVRHPNNSNSTLGHVLAVNPNARTQPGMEILNISKGTAREKELFNSMLVFHSRKRPTASQLLTDIDNLKEPVPKDIPIARPTPKRSILTSLEYYIFGGGRLLCAILVVFLAFVIFALLYFY